MIGFGLVPAPWNFVFLFLNGLPLGMIFGLVLGYLEGRQLTEALTAGLCASFIISSGIMKSIGRLMIENWGVSEYWMPALTGGLFFIPLVVSVWLLRQIPAPSAEDIRQRSERVPMRASERRAFFAQYGIGLSLLVIVYIALTVLRTMRDDFAVEIWHALGHDAPPEIYTYSETCVMFVVVALNGAAIWISRNRSRPAYHAGDGGGMLCRRRPGRIRPDAGWTAAVSVHGALRDLPVHSVRGHAHDHFRTPDCRHPRAGEPRVSDVRRGRGRLSRICRRHALAPVRRTGRYPRILPDLFDRHRGWCVTRRRHNSRATSPGDCRTQPKPPSSLASNRPKRSRGAER